MPDKRRWLPRWQRIELAELVLDRGWSRRRAAAWRRVSVSTVQLWVARRRAARPAEVVSGAWAEDRPSTPRRQPRRASEAVHDRVCEARRRTGWGPRLIAGELGMCHSTVSRCLERRGLSRPPRPAREAVRRYQWPCPGDLLQMDTKRFARFASPGQGAAALADSLQHHQAPQRHRQPAAHHARSEPIQAGQLTGADRRSPGRCSGTGRDAETSCEPAGAADAWCAPSRRTRSAS